MIKSLFPPWLLSKSADCISSGEESEEDSSTLKKLLCATSGHSVTQTPEPFPALTQNYSKCTGTHPLIGLQRLCFFNYCADFTYTFSTTYAKRTGNIQTAKFLRAPLVLSHPSCGTHRLVSSVLHPNPCKAERAFRQQPTTGNLSGSLPTVRQKAPQNHFRMEAEHKILQFCIWSTPLLFKSTFLDTSVINTNFSWILSFLLAKMYSQL